MARIRSIHPGIASDEVYMAMSMAAKAAWPVLWTECDDQGIFEWKPIVLKARIFPADNVDFSAILDEYERLGCVCRREIDSKQFGFIRNFKKYQRPKKPSYRFVLPDNLALFVGDSTTSTPPVPPQCPTSGGNPPQMKEEGGRGEEERKKEAGAISAPPANDIERSRRKPSRPLPGDWQCSDAIRAKARGSGFSDAEIDREVKKFRNYAAEKDRRCADWDAAARNWFEKAAEFAGKTGENGKPSSVSYHENLYRDMNVL